jgi:hypothetical protein
VGRLVVVTIVITVVPVLLALAQTLDWITEQVWNAAGCCGDTAHAVLIWAKAKVGMP